MKFIVNNKDGIRLARKLGHKVIVVSDSVFPDGELSLHSNQNIKSGMATIYFKFRPGADIDREILSLLTILSYRQNKKQTKLILPYLPYGRSCHSHSDQASRLIFILQQINKYVGRVYFLAPHPPRDFLKKYLPATEIVYLDINTWIIKMFDKKFGSYVLVAPDKGSRDTVARLSKLARKEYIYFEKKRLSSTKVRSTLNKSGEKIARQNKGKYFVVVDDMISTGGTLRETKKYLNRLSPGRIKFFVWHDLSAGSAKTHIKAMTTNSIEGKNFDLDLVGPIADNLKRK